jgi:hypothetical protein
MMDGKKMGPRENGRRKGRVLLAGCLAAVGIFIAVSAAETGAVCRAAEGDIMSPSGIVYRELWSTGKRLIDGLMGGSISPEAGARIVSQIFTCASDGALTKEEIESILGQMRRVDGMNL